MKLSSFFSLILIVLVACTNPGAKNNAATEKNQSVATAKSTSEKTPKNYTDYLEVADTLDVKYYNSGKVESVALSNYDGEKNVSLNYSENGNLQSKTVNFNEYPRVITEYDEQGKPTHQWTEGDVGGCIGITGTEYFWSGSGSVLKEITHANTNASCSEKVLIRNEKEFYENSTAVKSIKMYHQSYEGSADCPCGKWTDFNKQGGITGEREYSPCDGSPICE